MNILALGIGGMQVYKLLADLPVSLIPGTTLKRKEVEVEEIVADMHNRNAVQNHFRAMQSNAGQGNYHMPKPFNTFPRIHDLEQQRRVDFSNPLFHTEMYKQRFKRKEMDTLPYWMFDPLIGVFKPRSKTYYKL